MKTAKEHIIKDCKNPDTGKLPTWKSLEKLNIAYDLDGVEKLMEEYASQKPDPVISRERIIELIDSYWKFDEDQQHLSSWCNKQDLLKVISELAPEGDEECGVYVISRDGNNTTVFKNGEKLTPSEAKVFYGCKLTDKDKAVLDKTMKEYFDSIKQPQPEQDKLQAYHLNCDVCGKTYWSISAFPEPQWCEKCVKEYFDIKSEQKPTDEEIENKASDIADPTSKHGYQRGEWLGFKEGAKWMRDNQINK